MYKVHRNENNQFESVSELKRIDSKNAYNSDYMLKEVDLEELLSKNLEILFTDDSEKDMQIVGRQLFNTNNKRTDLIALADDGSLVVIELKRFAKDILRREEDFPMQAVRYATILATIKSTDELIEISYLPHLQKYNPIQECPQDYEAYYNKAEEKINNLLGENFDEDLFNQKQQIILVAFEFDEETYSSVAWLSENGIDIQCIEIQVYEDDEQHYIYSKKVLPSLKAEDFLVEFNTGRTKRSKNKHRNSFDRRNLPQIKQLIEWKIVEPGDTLYSTDRKGKATLLENGSVETDSGEVKSLQQWLKSVLGYSAVKTYMNTFTEEGVSLSELRRKYMDEHDIETEYIRYNN